METKTERSFVRSYLPWLVAAGALGVYFLTLNGSLSLQGVTGLARVTGWDWHPVYHAPLFYLLTLPIRWLPSGLQMFAANAFSMICAVLALALLARSVALLPQDRTREQRQHEAQEHGLLNISTAWLPPLLAVLVCGLQRSFWEQATMASGELLDLLIFAYVVRCLLEFRVDGRESWLNKLAVVYGVGTANNWAMIGFFPAILIALVWIMGLRFFRYRFLARTLLCGLAGLSLYLFLPLLHSWTDPVYGDFLKSLRFNLASQKQALSLFRPSVVLFLSLASLLPLFVIGIRWPSAMSDVSAIGSAATNFLMYLLHGGFFLLCGYMAFDPLLIPDVLRDRTGGTPPLLTWYYMGALCIGYFCGYFLLVFGRHTGKSWEEPSPLRRLINRAVTVAVWALALGVPVALAQRNLPRLQVRNSPELERYAQRLAESLPADGSVVLSDDPIRLYAVRAALGTRVDRYILLDTAALADPMYHRHLKQSYGNRLPEAPAPSGGLDFYPPQSLVALMRTMVAQQPVHYLHPSFGYYFESFHLLPRKLVYEMKLSPTNTLELPPLPAERIQEQEAYWRKLDTEVLPALKAEAAKKEKRPRDYAFNRLWVASYYSRACNDWGVLLQLDGHPDQALAFYQRALDLNPENPSAFVNLEWCRAWTKTGKPMEKLSDEAMSKLGPYAGNWDMLLSVNGSLDEPTFRLELAQVLVRSGLSRQAAVEGQRALAVSPKDLRAHMTLANVYVQANLPDRVLELTSKVRSTPALAPTQADQLELLQMEAWAYFLKNEMSRAESLLRGAQTRNSDQEGPFFTLAQMYLVQAEQARTQGQQTDFLRNMTNALLVFEAQMKVQPKNLSALINHGGISAQLEDYPRALASLTRAVEMNPSSEPARVNRAISALRAERYDEARRDYEYLLKLNPTSQRAYYGLGEIAFRKQEWSAAAEAYDLYLKHAPPNTSEYFFVQKRHTEVKKKVK